MTTALTDSYDALDERAARLCRFLACHPSGEVTDELAAALAGSSAAGGAATLDELTVAGLVEPVAPVAGHARYRLVAAIREHVAAFARCDPAEECAAAYGRLLEHYVATTYAAGQELEPFRDVPGPQGSPWGLTFAGRHQALQWLDIERGVLTALTHAPDTPPEVVARLVDARIPYWRLRQRPEEARVAHERALEAARNLGDRGDRRLVARLLLEAAAVECDHRPTRALQLVDEALRECVSGDDALLAAHALHHRALILRQLRQHEEAARVGQRAVVECIHAADRRTAALAHLTLARLALDEERYDEAAHHAATAEDMLRAAGDLDWLSLGRAGAVWARAEARLGHAGRACQVMAEATDMLRHSGAELECAARLRELGELHEQQAEHKPALVCYDEALVVATDAQGDAGLVDDLHQRINRLTGTATPPRSAAADDAPQRDGDERREWPA